MTLPSVFLGILIATACGLAYHVLRGGGLPRVVLYVAAAWVSFFSGHFAAEWMDWRILRLGTLNLLAGVTATILGLLLASFLLGPELKTRSGRRRTRNTDD